MWSWRTVTAIENRFVLISAEHVGADPVRVKIVVA